jgi:hypothetical protein
MKQAVIAAFVVVVLAAPAQGQSTCLQFGRIWSWKALDSKTLIVEDQLYHNYKVALEGFCPALPFKLSLGFKSNSGNNGLDCLRRGDEVISHDAGIPYTCPIMSITPYTPPRAGQPAPVGTR